MSAFRIPFAWGNTKFRDHVHHVLSLANLSPKRFMSPDFGLDNIMSLIWRVKTFAVTGSMGGTGVLQDSGGTHYPYTIPTTAFAATLTRQWEDNSSVFHDVADEQHLFGVFAANVYGSKFAVQDQGLVGLVVTAGPFVSIASPDFQQPVPSPGPGELWSATDDSLWIPPPFYNYVTMMGSGIGPILFGAQASVIVVVSGGTTTVTLTASNETFTPAGPQFGSYGFSMEGYTAAGMLSGQAAGDASAGFTVISQSNTGSFTVEATEYLPFSDSQGNPIYDSSTGALLNDPFG